MRAEKSAVGRLRREAGLTRRELAARAGLTEKTIWNYETGGLEFAKYGAVRRLAHALGVPMEDLEVEDDGADER